MAIPARQIPWPTATTLDLVRTQLSWPSPYPLVLSAAASVVTGIFLTLLIYNTVVPEKSLLVSQPKCQHLYNHRGNKLTCFTAGEPYTVLPQ